MSDPKALRQAAESIAKDLKDATEPNSTHGDSWRVTGRSGTFYVRSSSLGVIATENDLRHPLFAGPRNPGGRDHWYSTNQRNPGRTGWATRAFLRSLDRATEQYADAFARDIASSSPYLEVR